MRCVSLFIPHSNSFFFLNPFDLRNRNLIFLLNEFMYADSNVYSEQSWDIT